MQSITQREIRAAARHYKKKLEDSQWFNLKILNKTEWLTPLEKIINKEANSPALLWECVVDHWHATNWDDDGKHPLFVKLYDLVDEYRSQKGTDGVDPFNLLVDALCLHANQGTSPQSVISQLYEALSGNVLERDTDPLNGEDYFYKRAEHYPSSSCRLHPEVVEYFGLNNGALADQDGGSLFVKHQKPYQIGLALKNNPYFSV